MKKILLITVIMVIWITISAHAAVNLHYPEVEIHVLTIGRQYSQMNNVNVLPGSSESVNCSDVKGNLAINASDTGTGNPESNHADIGYNGHAIYFYGNGKTYDIKAYDDSGNMVTTFQQKNTIPGSRYHLYPYSCFPPADHNIYLISVSTDSCSMSFKFLNNKPVEFIEENPIRATQQ